MRWSRVIRAAISSGVVAAAMIAAAGRQLDVTIPPWAWASTERGWVGRTLEWLRTTVLLLPAGLAAAIVIGIACALVFEFVTRRAGWFYGAAIGLLFGVAGAEGVGLIPWFASWYGLSYAPAVRPIGTMDPTWFFAVLTLAGVLCGAIVGATYGSVLHTVGAEAAVRWREI